MVEAKTAEHVKSDLQRERAQVMKELAHLREAIQVEVDPTPEEADIEIVNRETAAILITVLERRLDHLTTALQAIELGTYGVCMRCGQPIEAERLVVRPEALLRLACQQSVETGTRR